MDLKEIFTSLTILCSVIIALITVLNFKRNRKIEIENVVYKYKIEGYFILVDKLAELIDIINKAIESIENRDFSKEDSNKSADEVDLKAEQLFNCALKYSLLFPQRIITLLDDIHALVNADPPNKFQESIEDALKIIYEHLQKLSNNIDALYDEMRKDLGSQQLNKSLSKRLS